MAKIWIHPLFLNETEIQTNWQLENETNIFDFVHNVCANENVMFNIFDEQKNLRPHVAVFIGSKKCRSLNVSDTIIKQDDEISIFPALSGG